MLNHVIKIILMKKLLNENKGCNIIKIIDYNSHEKFTRIAEK
jgi:hypothetical protein